MHHQGAPGRRRLLQLIVVFTIFGSAMSWVVPQPKANVWRTLARAMGQDHICLSQGSTEDPIASCLVGIPAQESELPPELLQWKRDLNNKPAAERDRKYNIGNPPWWKNPLFHGGRPTEQPQIRDSDDDDDDDDRSTDREDGPLEEQIERLQEKVESAQSEQKNLFLVIFQGAMMKEENKKLRESMKGDGKQRYWKPSRFKYKAERVVKSSKKALSHETEQSI
ncbi:hypothetical protein HGM15179_013889 [Zosterops borbonicus]|uniref:MIF4G-like type 2 domain-containing protein n=1 Tax=Zosterops borbonicus TaxID=364589 RepID=A0A8K1G789_9PASS|nr:hypothetical protein HGM15179_013889 [Zosterops borbonicus]